MNKYFITGLLVLVPVVVTFWVISTLIETLDQSLLLLPAKWQPQELLGFSVAGLGAILTLVVVFLTGVIATNFFGQQIILLWEAMLSRVPVVKSIYASVKQVSDTIFSDSGNAFRKALLIEFPRKGSWTIAFLTGEPGGDVSSHLKGQYVSVYVPTTPNPTGGYFLMMETKDIVELDMSVDQALKYIISMGTLAPELKSGKVLKPKQ
ncbi:MAG: DUF502 domain-containing protein [Methylophilaceae bacterium]|jgi:uncharacterized membrane protein|nr:DUF502 domain-containing protein [Methylophilaceae bacterium]